MQSQPQIAVPASRYNVDQLADIYNRTRIDYIVPMPMNGKRMMEYIQNYSINLDASTVAVLPRIEPIGLNMIGLRDQRAWATRLGVTPEYRGHKTGLFLMETLLERAASFNIQRVQLEVIQGNEPAYRLFVKLGFKPMRELLVIRRPPGAPPANPSLAATPSVPIANYEIPDYLALREPNAAWTEETSSILQAGNLQGLAIELPSGELGWIVFQRLPFQLTHFVFSPNASVELASALLYKLHELNPLQDTKIENVPIDHSTWEAYQSTGYIEVFRRIEMIKTL
jgi:ribosomal protein S18 acetylase RimI-like enzyme